MAFIDEARSLYEDKGRELIHSMLPEYEGLIHQYLQELP